MNSALENLADSWRHAARHSIESSVAHTYEDCALDLDRTILREVERRAARMSRAFPEKALVEKVR